jgi:hypothetical protein
MNKLDMTLVAISFILFLTAPFLPTTLYKMAFSNMIVPLVLLVALLVSLRTSPIGSVTFLLAVMALFVEYRARVISMSLPSATKAPEYEQQLAPAPPVVPDEVHPEPKLPSGKMVYYKPAGETGTNIFETVNESINQKRALEGPRLPEEATKFLVQQGLA